MSSLQISAIFFVVGTIAVVPVLYYHYKKHPHPRFRPPVGEMVMLSLFALVIVGGGSYFMGTLMSSDPSFDDDGPIYNQTRRAADDDSPAKKKSKSKSKSNNPFSR